MIVTVAVPASLSHSTELELEARHRAVADGRRGDAGRRRSAPRRR